MACSHFSFAQEARRTSGLEKLRGSEGLLWRFAWMRLGMESFGFGICTDSYDEEMSNFSTVSCRNVFPLSWISVDSLRLKSGVGRLLERVEIFFLWFWFRFVGLRPACLLLGIHGFPLPSRPQTWPCCFRLWFLDLWIPVGVYCDFAVIRFRRQEDVDPGNILLLFHVAFRVGGGSAVVGCCLEPITEARGIFIRKNRRLSGG